MTTNEPGPVDRTFLDRSGPAPEALPAAVDQYRLLRPLGRGGMGIVCEAEDLSLGRRVAIKLVPGIKLKQILREAQFASAVRHPHVVSLFDTGRYAGGVYLVMELVNGRSVQSLLGNAPLPWRDATAILVGACTGVMATHARGIIHRDIKPANLLHALDGTVKLTDFGLACWLDRSKPRPGEGGTPHYMSPEQCRADDCDERTDIYALGATYHTLLTGWTPFGDATPLKIMFEHCSAPVPDPRKGHGEIPNACAEIVMRAMAKKRADRYDSVREMRNALRGVLRRRSKAWPI